MSRVLLLLAFAGTAAAQAIAPGTETRSVTDSQSSGAIAARVRAQHLAHESTDDRIRTYERLMKATPESVASQLGLIGAYLQKVRESADFGYLDRAAKLVDCLLQKDSGDSAALRYRNEIDLQRHEFRTVAERSETMIQDNPSDPGNWATLGDASMELGNYDRAGQAYLRMFSLQPGLGSYNRLAYWRFVTGDGDTALQLMRQAVEAGDNAPENTAWCLAELGDMYFKLGKVPEAAHAYTDAIDLFPRLHRAWAGLGKTRAGAGDTEAAIRSYERAQSIVPLVEYAGALEDLYTASGSVKNAARERDLIATIETLGKVTNEKTNRNLALLLADHNRDLDLALTLMRAEVPVRGDLYTWDALSWVLFRNGRLAEAKEASAKALRLGTPEPLFYYHAAQIAAATSDGDAIRQFSSRLLSLNPHFDFGKTGPLRPSAP
jgi:tetratricopeptide (TPR) repeat protein